MNFPVENGWSERGAPESSEKVGSRPNEGSSLGSGQGRWGRTLRRRRGAWTSSALVGRHAARGRPHRHDCNIQKASALHVVLRLRGGMQITIVVKALNGKHLYLEVDSGITAAELHAIVSDRAPYCSEAFYLYNGRNLTPPFRQKPVTEWARAGRTLVENGLTDPRIVWSSCTVHMLPRLGETGDPFVNAFGRAYQASLRTYRAEVMAGVAANADYLGGASCTLQADIDVVMAAVTAHGMALRYAAQELKADRGVVSAAVSQNGHALQFASMELKTDREILLLALQHGLSLEDAASMLLPLDDLPALEVVIGGMQDAEALTVDLVADVLSVLGEISQRPVALSGVESELLRELSRLKLFQYLRYLPQMFSEEITAATLTALGHEELRELGMATIGARTAFMQAVQAVQVVQLPEDVPPAQTAQAKFDAFYARMGIAAAIEGLQATPLSPIREAVAFIEGLDDAPSQAELAAACDVALHRAQEILAAGADEYGLTCDEIAATHLYTQPLLFRALNRALWSKERGAVKPYWGYIRLLQHALFKLPKSEAGTIYRGIKDPYQDPQAPLTEAAMLAKAVENGGSGEPEIWWGFSSCSTDLQQVNAFLGHDGVRVLYTIEGGSSARDVRRYSDFQHEAEVLMPFGSAFTVVTATTPAPNLLLVTLRQTHDFALPAQVVPIDLEQEGI
eukprot:COSAG02_NODE_630_length_19310_cov_19.127271_11_plen_682_part_00